MNKYISFIFLLAFVGFHGKELRACSCIAPPPPSEAFENYDTVFMARVTSFKHTDEHNRVAKFRLLKLWKGKETFAGEVFTGANDGDCGFDFVVGKTYVIYAYMTEKDELRTDICTRTAALEQAREDLTFLDQRNPLFTQEDTPEDMQEDSGCCGSMSGGDAILAGGVLLFLFRRRNYTHAA